MTRIRVAELKHCRVVRYSNSGGGSYVWYLNGVKRMQINTLWSGHPLVRKKIRNHTRLYFDERGYIL